MDTMKLGSLGEQLIKGFEKCMLAPYRDNGGILTVGWGHTAAAGGYIPEVGVAITRAEADQIFARDIATFVARVNRLVTADINQNQFDALVSFEFNSNGLYKSTLLKLINSNRFSEVPSEMMKWVRAKVDGRSVEIAGLVNRRRAEVRLWLTPTADEFVADPEEMSAAQDVDPPQTKGMLNSKIGNSAIVVGGASGVGIITQVTDAMDQANQAVQSSGGLAYSLGRYLTKLVSSPHAYLYLILFGIAVAIWVWRYENMRGETE